VFRALNRPDLIQILDLEVKKVMERLRGRNIQLQLEDKAKDFLVEKGYDPIYGARPMRRAVERYLEDPLAEEILKGHLHENNPIQVTLEADKLVFKQAAAAQAALSSCTARVLGQPTRTTPAPTKVATKAADEVIRSADYSNSKCLIE